MKITRVKVTNVQEWENNARIHGKRNLDTLKNSLLTFGQTKPIVVQKSSMRVIAGNGTLQAIKAIGWDEVDCHILDIEDAKANSLAIMDNRTSDLSEWDEKVLFETLNDMDSDLLALTGFDDKEIEKMLKFQDGSLFEEKKEKKKKDKKTDADFVNYDDQVSFVLMGYPFVLADKEKISEIQHLIEFLKDADKEVKEDVAVKVFDEIQKVLTEKIMR